MRSIDADQPVLYDGRVCVYCASVHENQVQIYDSTNAIYLVVKVSELRPVLTKQPETSKIMEVARSLEELDEEAVEAERRFKTIDSLLSLECSKKESIQAISEVMGISVSYAYKLVANHSAEVGPTAFIREVRGRKRGTKMVDARLESIIAASIEEKWKRPSASVIKVYNAVKEKCHAAGLKPPARNTVAKRIFSGNPAEIERLRRGKKASDDRHKGRPTKIKVTEPLQLWQMDHTVINVIIVDEHKRAPLCRPWVTLIIDVCTRVVMGYYLSIHAPNSLSVAMAISHAVNPKDTWLNKLELSDVSYPYYGKPATIGLDNAKEFRSLSIRAAAVRNNIKLRWRPVRTPHYGGHIERLNGTLEMGHVRYLPGATLSNVVMRGDYNSESESTMTFPEFEEWFARSINIYHLTNHRILGVSPHEKWISMFKDSSGRLHHPPLIENPEEFFLDFLPQQSRVISSGGVQLHKIFYWSNSFKMMVNDGKKYEVKYNPLSLRKIWLRDEYGRYIEAPYSDLSKPDVTLEELRIVKASPDYKIGTNEDEIFRMVAANRELVSKSVSQTKRMRKAQESLRLARKNFTEESEDYNDTSNDKSSIDYSVPVVRIEPEE